MKGSEHTNYPFRVCSLTTAIRRETVKQSVVTMSPEGNVSLEMERTRNQSERLGKLAGRRPTNDRKLRKSNPADIADRAGYIRLRRPLVRCGKSDGTGEVNGYLHPIHRRSKRRWHAMKVTICNWGGPVQSPIINSVVKTDNRVTTSQNNLSVAIPDCSNRQSNRRQVRECTGIRRNAEIQYIYVQEVGDGRSSVDGKDNITFPEQRAISLNIQSMKYKGRR